MKQLTIAIVCAIVITLNSTPCFGQYKGLPFVMDMVHNNPGDAPYITKYNDPEYLRSQGYNATVPKWFVTCAITYDNFRPGIVPKNSAERIWIEHEASVIDQKLATCKKAGLKVYPFTDFIVFPSSIWKKYGDSIRNVQDMNGSSGNGKSENFKPDIQRKFTQQLLRAQIDGVFKRFPKLDGIDLRFGETYLFDTPFHNGGSPIRSGAQGIQDQITFINILREEVCVKRNKMLFYRTWDFGDNFHNNPEYYLAVTNAIKPHPNLIFSIKYQQGDFLRMTPFNPTLGIGKHRQIVESQSSMEAYGKGSHPYYSAFGVINGWPETKYEIKDNQFTGKLNDPRNPRGLKDIVHNGLLCGINTWSRGGGWKGPYIADEFWIDLNTYVVSHWAEDTSKTEESFFYEFASLHHITGMDADRLRQIALLSIEGVRKGQCNSFTKNELWWARDQSFSFAANKEVIQSIMDGNLSDKVLAEKAEASAIWLQIEAISKELSVPDTATQEAIRVSCAYGRIKYELIEQMWIMMLENAKAGYRQQTSKQVLKVALDRYDELCSEWQDLYKSSKYCATLYTDLGFNGNAKGSIGEFVSQIRKEIN